MRRQQLQQQKPQQVCLTCLLGEEWCFNCGEPWHISPGTFPIWQEEGTRTEVRRRKRQRGKVERGEEEWCTNCMRYGHEEHHCLEVFQDTDLEWEEPERPAPERGEPERPAPEWEEPERPKPKREESVRPQPKKGKAKGPQPRYLPAEGEFLLVTPPSPWEDYILYTLYNMHTVYKQDKCAAFGYIPCKNTMEHYTENYNAQLPIN
ncbi:UNVERIFIED_CONTAM: hypothetical protein FKN15_075103 [Acipenser sinensis]